jgi:hypothetical protein
MSGPERPGLLGDLFEAADEHPREQRVLVVLGVVGVALFLVLGAFFVGRGIADGGGTSEEATAAAADAGTSAGQQGGGSGGGDAGQGGSTGHASTTSNGKLVGPAYRGAVDPVAVGAAHATCRAPAGVDSAGNRVSYAANNMLDSAASTAWRCNGEGRGVTLTFSLRHPRRIAQVGLVPGYAKTDPYSGADRYAENRRISKVRWSFDGGAWVEQTFRTGRFDRGMQTMRIPSVRASRVSVTIEDSVRGPRNTVAVSTVNLGSPR